MRPSYKPHYASCLSVCLSRTPGAELESKTHIYKNRNSCERFAAIGQDNGCSLYLPVLSSKVQRSWSSYIIRKLI